MFDAAKQLGSDPKRRSRRALDYLEQGGRDLAATAGPLRPTASERPRSHPVLLRVGVRELPRFLSPALACRPIPSCGAWSCFLKAW